MWDQAARVRFLCSHSFRPVIPLFQVVEGFVIRSRHAIFCIFFMTQRARGFIVRHASCLSVISKASTCIHRLLVGNLVLSDTTINWLGTLCRLPSGYTSEQGCLQDFPWQGPMQRCIGHFRRSQVAPQTLCFSLLLCLDLFGASCEHFFSGKSNWHVPR